MKFGRTAKYYNQHILMSKVSESLFILITLPLLVLNIQVENNKVILGKLLIISKEEKECFIPMAIKIKIAQHFQGK